VRRRSTRPLLRTADPAATMKALMAEREPIYGRADLTIMSRDDSIDMTVEDALQKLAFHLRFSPEAPALPSRKSIMTRSGDAAAPMDSNAADETIETVRVELAARSYDIRIGGGLLATVGQQIAAALPGAACAIVTDENVAAVHYPALTASLSAAGVRHVPIIVPPGEESKSWAQYTRVCEAIIEARLERGDVVVALGGGVVGDLAGFAAASVRRGMRLVQIPTSLLAQVDSSVGGKTGINSAHGKNLVGAFYQPALVLADPGVLTSLPLREFRAGYAEVVKYGLINDLAFFDWLEGHWAEVFAGGMARARAIATSCAAKAGVVARDEHEAGERALLNLGHTFGHALERLVAYDGARLVHGEGVAIGLVCAFKFSERLGLSPASDSARVVAHLQAAGLPTRIRDIPGWTHEADAILTAMRQDKKVERGALTFILVRGIGQAFVAKNIGAADVEAFLRDELADKADAAVPMMASAAGH
jgi:shikimate kinase/3-dehydroquinate synthase